MTNEISTWLQFWNQEQSIYVSRRHLESNYRSIADDFLTLEPNGHGKTLLDYGCGDALATPRFVAAGYHVILFDPAELMQQKARRFEGKNVAVYHTLDEIPAQTADIILIVSVLQYLSKIETREMLKRLRSFLKPHGVLYVADVVPPDASMIRDVYSLLSAGLHNGFFFAALVGLAETFFSDYRSLREKAGFTTWAESDFLALLSQNGLAGERLEKNIGHNQGRMTFRIVIAASSSLG